jgi:hypothetical protein
MFGFYSDVEVESVLGWWSVSLGEQFLEIKTAHSVRMTGTVYPTTWCYISEDFSI